MKFIFIILVVFSTMFSKEISKKDDVTLQLSWKDQFQFAGYYIAKELGYYDNTNINIDIKEYTYGTNIVEDVVGSKNYFGVGRSSLLIDKANGKDIQFLFTTFQESPLVLLSLKRDDLNSIKDFKNKKVMMTPDATSSVPILSMLRSKQIDIKDMIQQPHSFNIKDLIENKTDLMASYVSNEPYILKKLGIEYKIFDPKDYGFSFYDDILFTSSKLTSSNKDLVDRFYKASYKGWLHAFANIEQTAKIIYKKYNSQNKTLDELIFEGYALKKLAFSSNNKFGSISVNRLDEIQKLFSIMGVMDKTIEPSSIIFNHILENKNNSLTKSQKKFVDKNNILKVCYKQDKAPIEYQNKIHNNTVEGMAVDVLNLVAKKLDIGLNYDFIPYATLESSFEMIKNRNCDMILSTEKINNNNNLHLTNSYFNFPVMIISSNDSDIVRSYKEIDPKNLLLAPYYYQRLKNEYPNKEFINIENIQRIFKQINKGDNRYSILPLPIISHYTKSHGYSNVKIVGSTDIVCNLRMAFRDDLKVMRDIFNIGLVQITQKELDEIFESRVSLKYEKSIDYTTILEILIVFLVVLLIFGYKTYELKSAHAFKDAIFNRSKDIILISKEGKNMIDSNQAFVEFFGTSNIDSYKKGAKCICDLFEKDDGFLQKYMGHLLWLDYLLQNSDEQIMAKIIKDDKEYIFYLTAVNFIHNKITYAYVTLRDITQIYEVQKALEDANLKIKEQENMMISQSRYVAMGETIKMLAHQWRQPLAAISMQINNILLDINMGVDVDKNGLESQLTDISSTIIGLSDTINKFQNFFKYSNDIEDVTISNLIDDIKNLLDDSLVSNQIEVKYDTDNKTKIKTYKKELEQVILNIIKNSIEAFELNKKLDSKKMIQIDISTKSKKVVISIKDNAGGLKGITIDKIFEPYISTKEKRSGVGIGLYMTKTILEKHLLGNIEAIEVDGGLRVEIIL